MNALIGIFELAIGRANGFTRFAVSPRALGVSFAVLMSVPALLSLVLMGRQGVGAGLAVMLAVLCALLTPVVVSHLLARVWDREPWWLRFAIAFNWSRIALTAIYALLLTSAAVLMGLGYPNQAVAVIVQGVMIGYTLWFDWFLVRQGLQVSGGRAALGVLAINFGTFLLVFGPLMLTQAMAPERASLFN